MPFWASKCTQPSPRDGCKPRTRATSYAMPATFAPCENRDRTECRRGPPWTRRAGPIPLRGHTSAVSLASGVLVAWALLIIPGATVARAAQLTWPTAVAVAPALTYGTVALAILPFGATGVPWNLGTALIALLVVVAVVAGLQAAWTRWRDDLPAGEPMARGPALVVAAGVA